MTYTTGVPDRWLGAGGQGSFGISGNTITLETIGGGKPNEMIAPAVADGGVYSNVNNGFQQFNPYNIGPATFSLALSGVTSLTTVTAVTFSFGTSPDTFLSGDVRSRAVRDDLALAGMVTLGLVGLIRSRRTVKTSPGA